MSNSYDCSSRGYLHRASALIAKDDLSSLFYAAFELRCGVEARMREYLEVAEKITERQRKGWKIPELAMNLEKAFRVGDRIVEVIFNTSDTHCILFYTPVTSQLGKCGARLDEYRHAMVTRRRTGDPWWQSFRILLEETCSGLKIATTGTLLGPPLLNPNGTRIKTHEEHGIEPHNDKAMKAIASSGKVEMSFNFLDTLPASIQ